MMKTILFSILTGILFGTVTYKPVSRISPGGAVQSPVSIPTLGNTINWDDGSVILWDDGTSILWD